MIKVVELAKSLNCLLETKNAKYLSLDFCDLEILVAMVELDDSIAINIWNWRTVERIAVVSSAIEDPKHQLRYLTKNGDK